MPFSFIYMIISFTLQSAFFFFLTKRSVLSLGFKKSTTVADLVDTFWTVIRQSLSLSLGHQFWFSWDTWYTKLITREEVDSLHQ